MENAQHEQKQDGEQDCHFLSRVTKLPVVRSAMDKTLDIYQKAKEYNGLVGIALQSAEKTALIASERAKPVFAKFETQIEFVDGLACKTLDKLEQSMPIVTKDPEVIMAESKKMYEDTILKPALNQLNGVKEYGMGKITVLKDYGVKTATTLASTNYGRAVTGAVDEFLFKADVYVDDYLPAKFGYEECAMLNFNPEAGTFENATVLSHKLQQRIVCHGRIQLKAAKVKADEVLSALKEIANLLSLRLTVSKVVFEHANATVNRVLLRMKGIEDLDKLSMEQKVFLAAKQLTAQLHQNYQKVSSTLKMLPATFQPKIQLVQSYIMDVYGQFSTAKSLNEVSNVVLIQMQEGMKRLHIIYDEVYDYLFTKRAISVTVGCME